METDPRINTLYASLSLEHVTSMVLGELLDIDTETSKTLGSKSSSLSFKNKIDLISDIRAMDSDDAKKMLCFAEIRNQFLHNLKVDTYSACFKNLEGKANYLKKTYNLTEQEGQTEEQLLKNCFDALSADLIKNVIGKLFGKVQKKYYDLGKTEGSQRFGELVLETMNKMQLETPDLQNIFEEVLNRAEKLFDEESENMNPSNKK
jgi:hypothetical protein